MDGLDLAVYAAQTADDKRGTEIVIYDVRGTTDVTDFFVLVTAHSRAQIRAITETIRRALKGIGIRKLGQEGDATGQWILLDYADVVIHVFSPQLRAYYSLESLWGDAPKIDWAARQKIVLPVKSKAAALAGDEDAAD